MKYGYLMLCCVVLAGCGAAAIGQDAAPAAMADKPAIGFEALTTFDRLPLLVDWPAKQDASFSRQRKNEDANQYIRKDPNGELVMAEAKGPGVIYRMWGTGATGTVHPHPDTRYMFYFDGADKPSMTLSAQELFGDKGAKWPFVPPLSRTFESGSGGMEGPASICYVPIPFAKSMKVTTNNAMFYHVDYITYPEGTPVQTFTFDLAEKNRATLEKAAAMFLARGQMPNPPADLMTAAEGPVEIPAGKTAVLFEGKGPAVVRALRVKLALASDANLRGLVLQVQYDGSNVNSVNVPIGDFFGAAGSDLRFRSLPLGATDAGYYCYFPMPYRQSIRIQVLNETSAAASLTRNVEVQKVAALPTSAGYFHAAFNHEVLTPVGTDYNMLDVQGAAGKFVGCNILMQSASGMGGVNFLEGDEHIYVDNETKWPSRWCGTGTEDYFNGAYYWNAVRREDMDLPFGGITLRDDALRRVSAYRFHITDFISFQNRVRVDIEHGGVSEWPNDYASTAYYYLAKPMAAKPLEPVAQRIVRTEVMGGHLMMGCRFEGPFTFDGKAVETRGQKGEPQLETGKIQIGVGPPYVQYFCSAKEIGQEMTGKLFVPGADQYNVTAYLAVGPNYGKYGVYIEGRLVGYINTFAPNFHPAKAFPLGLIGLKEGANKLVFRAEGRDENATGMDFGLVVFQCSPTQAAPINKWLVAGTFPCPKDGGWEKANGPETDPNPAATYEVTFGAEKRAVKWQPKDNFWSSAVFGDAQWVCCYAMTYVWSPKDQKVGLFMAKDDALKVWVNGQVEFDNNSWSHFLSDQFIASCPLKQGWNRILVKNGNWDGMWGFSIKITDPARELRITNEPPAEMGGK